MTTLRRALACAALAGSAALLGCRSPRIDATVENRTGGAIELLEVDYPSASFGADSLASGASFHYRFQTRGSGPVKVQYTESATHIQRQASGPQMLERQQGSLRIVLGSNGQVLFTPNLRIVP